MEPLDQAVEVVQEHPFLLGLLPHLLTVAGGVLIFLAIARLMSERRQPGNTFAWLFAIIFVPYVGVPLFLLFGGRKVKKLVARKHRICPVLPDETHSPLPASAPATVLTRNGVCPPVGGNKVTLLTDGEEAFAAIEKGIREAQHTIHIMTFILGRDKVGRRIVELLAERAREGVKVRLLLDALGCFTTSGGFCDPLREAGGEVAKFMPVLPLQTRGSANLRNHRKIAVIDHRYAGIGGRNLAAEYMGPAPLKKRWRDFGAVVEGPAVALLNEIFLADWSYASGQSFKTLRKELPDQPPEAVGDSRLQIVASGPDVENDPLYEGILSVVETAERSIWIVTPYFIPDEVLFRLLQLKARSGVDVRVVVPAKSNHPITDFARRHFLRELQAAGAKVLYYGPGMNHAKLILADESIGLWGSANLDLRSLFVNFEVSVVTYSEEDAKAMAAYIRDVFAHSQPMPAPSRHWKFFPAVGEEMSRLLAPLL